MPAYQAISSKTAPMLQAIAEPLQTKQSSTTTAPRAIPIHTRVNLEQWTHTRLSNLSRSKTRTSGSKNQASRLCNPPTREASYKGPMAVAGMVGLVFVVGELLGLP